MHGAGESAAEMAARKRRQAAEKRADADRLDREASSWERGSEGERQIGAALEAGRPHGWLVLHDVRWPGRPKANIDHVAVGPGGILVVDAKNWSGSVTLRDGVLRQSGFRRTREVDAVGSAALAVGELLNLPWSLHVIPVLALVDQPELSTQRVGAVTVVAASGLTAWMCSLPPQLGAADVIGLTDHLRTALGRGNAFSSERAVGGPVSYGQQPLAHLRRPRLAQPPVRARGDASRRARRSAPARRRELLKAVAALAFVAFLALGGLPLYLKLATGAGSVAAKAVVPSPTQVPASPPPVFASCAALDTRYPFGVERPGAVNRGARMHGTPRIDAATYARNARLDADHDGIACER